MPDPSSAVSAQLIDRSVPFSGRLLRVELDRAKEPAGPDKYGPEVRREVVRHPGAVAIVAVTPERRLVMVRQYRYAAGRFLLEIPAGTLEPGEHPEDTARRELREETGYSARTLRPLGSFFSAPGFCDEVIHLFRAEGLTPGEQDTDFGEDIDLVEIPVAEGRRRLAAGGFEDAKTLAGLGLFFLEERGRS
ncbi:MAG: NUDIX hydrolase [Acidobacteriota bacterium]|nr:NUDIX hydrolase [Acidobacteriota bacterium]